MTELQDAYAADDDGRAALEAKRQILVEAIEAARPSRRDLAGLISALNEVDRELKEITAATAASILDGFTKHMNDRKGNQEKIRARIAAAEGASSDGSDEPRTGSK